MGVIQDLSKFGDALQEIANDFDSGEFSRKVGAEAASMVYDDLSEIYDYNIKKFYDSYRPGLYHRTYSLYDSYKITINGAMLSYESNSDLYPNVHNQEAGIVYKVTMEQGFHGGPMWRKYPPFLASEMGIKPWSEKSRVAKSSIAPESRIIVDISRYENSKVSYLGVGLKDRMEQAMQTVKYTYDIFNFV